jgi:hypothetical protein
LAALNAIPLGMERSVEKHPYHQTRHSVGMPPKYFWTHSYGMCCTENIAHFYRAIHSYGMKKRKRPATPRSQTSPPTPLQRRGEAYAEHRAPPRIASSPHPSFRPERARHERAQRRNLPPFLPYNGNKGLALRWEVPRSARNDGRRGRRAGAAGTSLKRTPCVSTANSAHTILNLCKALKGRNH